MIKKKKGLKKSRLKIRSMSSVDLNNLSLKELQKLVKKEYNENKKFKKDKKQNDELKQEKPKTQTKSFDDYFQECIKNQTITKDTPHYLKKALERALKEYNFGIKDEKSAFDNFAESM